MSIEIQLVGDCSSRVDLGPLMGLLRDVRITTLERDFVEVGLSGPLVEPRRADIGHGPIAVGVEILHGCSWLVHDHLRLGDVWLERALLHLLYEYLLLGLFKPRGSLVLILE